MSHPTPRASTPRYAFRLAHPATQRAITLIAATPALAITACGDWLAVPAEQLAVTRRSPVREHQG